MSVWFTSDQHYGHALMAELRGFGSIAEHDDAIDANYRAKIRKADDQVWFLGDLSLKGTPTALEPILERVRALPGRKHLIAGNHDPVHPMHREAHKIQRLYLTAFESVQAFARRRILGEDVLLSHFPYTVDRGFEARFPQYRLPDMGLRLLHGHTHLPERRTSEREIHVGLDAWGLCPVHVSQIEALWNGHDVPVLHYVRLLVPPAVCEFGCDAPAHEVGYGCPSCSTPQTAVLCGDHLKALEHRLSAVTRIGGSPNG